MTIKMVNFLSDSQLLKLKRMPGNQNKHTRRTAEYELRRRHNR